MNEEHNVIKPELIARIKEGDPPYRCLLSSNRRITGSTAQSASASFTTRSVDAGRNNEFDLEDISLDVELPSHNKNGGYHELNMHLVALVFGNEFIEAINILLEQYQTGSLSFDQLPEPEKDVLESLILSTSTGADYSKLNWNKIYYALYSLYKLNNPIGLPDPEYGSFKKAITSIDVSNLRDTTLPIALHAQERLFDSAEALQEVSWEDRVRLHERTHIADIQNNRGKLGKLKVSFNAAQYYIAKAGSTEFSRQIDLDRLTGLYTLIRDVLEARAYISDALASPITNRVHAQYCHGLMAYRFAPLLMRAMIGPNFFWSTYIQNKPSSVLWDTNTGEERFNHEVHDGGALLLAFVSTADINRIVQDENYTSFFDGMSESQGIQALLSRINQLTDDPEQMLDLLLEVDDKLYDLLHALIKKYDELLASGLDSAFSTGKLGTQTPLYCTPLQQYLEQTTDWELPKAA